MENVLLTVHLILAVLLIGVVLLQRSEGGGLGLGGGSGGVMTGRQAANALSRLTWFLAAAFLVTSLSLTVLAAQKSGGNSVIDQLDINAPATGGTGLPSLDNYAPPPPASSPSVAPGLPATPPAAALPGGDAAVTPAPATPPSAGDSATQPATQPGN